MFNVDTSFSSVQSFVDTNNLQETAQATRGGDAVMEMINRKGMLDQADLFFAEESKEPCDYYSYFIEAIRKNKDQLPSSPDSKDYAMFAHQIFNIYRTVVVEKACNQVEANLQKWTFTVEEWAQKKQTFQDFIWCYAKTTWSGSANKAITDTMKKEFFLPNDFSPAVYSILLQSDRDHFFPNS